MQGAPPPGVIRWRSEIEKVIFSNRTGPNEEAEARRRYFWSTVSNGDCRKHDAFEHYEVGCCRDKADTVAKLLHPDLGLAAMLRKPRVFPRKSWTGQAEAAAEIAQMVPMHGLAAKAFSSVAGDARARLEAVRVECLARAASTQKKLSFDLLRMRHSSARMPCSSCPSKDPSCAFWICSCCFATQRSEESCAGAARRPLGDGDFACRLSG